METQAHRPNPPINLPAQAWRHIVHTLVALLPPPVEDTPDAILTRNHAAIASITALGPVDVNEGELAAQCVAARAQAGDVLRLIRLHAADLALVIKLNAQYAAMLRASLSAHNRLRREQQQRRTREALNSAAEQEERTRRITPEALLSALPSISNPQQIQKQETKYHTQKIETAKRQSWPEPATVASIHAMMDAAMRSAVPGWQRPDLQPPRNAPRPRRHDPAASLWNDAAPGAAPLPNRFRGELMAGTAQTPGEI